MHYIKYLNHIKTYKIISCSSFPSIGSVYIVFSEFTLMLRVHLISADTVDEPVDIQKQKCK